MDHAFRNVNLLKLGNFEDAWAQAGMPGMSPFSGAFNSLPGMATIVDKDRVPIPSAAVFLAHHALRSNGVTSDSVRTYGEALLHWFRFLHARSMSYSEATEETLGIYRAEHSHALKKDGKRVYATATTNLRVAVAVQFHDWGERTGIARSPLGTFLRGAHRDDPRAMPRLRVIRRLPKMVTSSQFAQIIDATNEPYRLIFSWALATGARRFECGGLRISDLPGEERLRGNPDGLLRVEILRKGGRELSLMVPSRLVHRTWWYIRTERPTPRAGAEDLIFLSQRRAHVSRATISAEFRRCADLIGSDATLHHLRHTFAVEVVSALENMEGLGLNSLKVAQVLLGHARSETSEIYLEARDAMSDPVAKALSSLFRWAL